MPVHAVERDIPVAGMLSAADLKGISETSCGVLQKPGGFSANRMSEVREAIDPITAE